jgi:hypothetical protein
MDEVQKPINSECERGIYREMRSAFKIVVENLYQETI